MNLRNLCDAEQNVIFHRKIDENDENVFIISMMRTSFLQPVNYYTMKIATVSENISSHAIMHGFSEQEVNKLKYVNVAVFCSLHPNV